MMFFRLTKNVILMRNCTAQSLLKPRCLSNLSIPTDQNGIPLFGLGCYKLNKHETEMTIITALEAGYRLFDTAQSYRNEKYIGHTLKKFGIARDEIFLVSKLSDEHGYESARSSLMKSLENLQVDFVDLYLIHSPSKGRILETWTAFEELQSLKLTKRIGVSNFNIHHLEGLIKKSNSIPQVNQIEHHPWHQQIPLVQYCRDKNISVMGYCPLARMKLLSKESNHVVNVLADKYGKTESQVLLRWSIQKNIITIPKSVIPERIQENIQIFDFELDDKEMQEMDTLDCQHQIASITAIHEPWTG